MEPGEATLATIQWHSQRTLPSLYQGMRMALQLQSNGKAL